VDFSDLLFCIARVSGDGAVVRHIYNTTNLPARHSRRFKGGPGLAGFAVAGAGVRLFGSSLVYPLSNTFRMVFSFDTMPMENMADGTEAPARTATGTDGSERSLALGGSVSVSIASL
jgi:hypothetical protein